MVEVLVGLDPGGRGAFGWATVEDAHELPLRILASGVANCAAEAVQRAVASVKSAHVLAAGIDAPLYWVACSDRFADGHLRNAICQRGAPGGTVQHVNSLRGACLIQGMMGALLLRRDNAELPISEAHPKALLWLLKVAAAGTPPPSVSLDTLGTFFRSEHHDQPSEHERDAMLGALSAWALLHRPVGWCDLSRMDEGAISPLTPPPAYWMPLQLSTDRSSPPAR